MNEDGRWKDGSCYCLHDPEGESLRTVSRIFAFPGQGSVSI